jgi:hypothetical protein
MPWNRKDYPPDWEQIRERILDRAGNCCESCGLPNGAIIRKKYRDVPGPQEWDMYNSMLRADYSKQQAMSRMGFTRIVLTIAHLDHDKDNWQVTDDRLRAWCQKCHLGHDLSRHVENKKYGRNHRKNQHKLW